MNKKMNLFFFQALVVGALGGYLCTFMSSHYILAGLVGFIISFFSLFIGMTLAFMQSKAKLKNELSVQQEEFQTVLRAMVLREKQACSLMSLNMAKSMSDKVANKIVSKYVDGLSDSGRRDAVLSSVTQIIEDEFEVMREGVLKGREDE